MEKKFEFEFTDWFLYLFLIALFFMLFLSKSSLRGNFENQVKSNFGGNLILQIWKNRREMAKTAKSEMISPLTLR